MSQELKQLFNQYKEAGNTESFDQFLQAKEELGDEVFYNYVNSQIDLKKKDQPSLTETSSPEISLSDSGQNPPISQEIQGAPMENWEESVPMGSEMNPIFSNQPLDQVSSESDITVEQPSTGLPLTETASSGIGDTIPEGVALPHNPNNYRLTNIEPYIQQNDVGNVGLVDTAQQINPITITQAEQTGDDIFSQVPSWMTDKTEDEKKQEQEYFDKYVPKDYINGNLKARTYTEGQFIGGDKQSLGINSEGKELTSKFYNTPEEGVAKMNDYLKKGYVTFEKNSDGEIATDESGVPLGRITKLGEETFNSWSKNATSEAKDNIGDKNIDIARHNYYQSLQDKPTLTPLQDYYNEYYKKTGELFDSQNEERITTERGQAEVLAEGIARKRVKDNPALDFNTEYQNALNQESPYTDEQLSLAGRNLLLGTFSNAVNTTENVHRILAESKGQTYQSDFDKEKEWLQQAADNPLYVKKFAEYWFNSDSGIKKYGASETRLNAMLNSQEGRAEIFDDFKNYINIKDGSIYEANKNILDKTRLAIKKAKESRDEVGLRQNIEKLNSITNTINANKEQSINTGSIEDARIKAQTIVLKQNMELAKNEAEYENATLGTLRGHVGAVLNGIADAGKDLVLGIPRLVNTIAGDNDAVNYVLNEISKPTQILNVRSSGITDTVSTFKLDGKTIVNRNGFWFEKDKNGDLVPTTISYEGMSKMQLEETKKDFSAKGLFGTVANQATMMFGAELAGGKVLSLLSKGLGRTVASATEVYGAESSMVKGLQLFDKFAKNPTNNGIVGWTLSTIEGNAQEAEMRGMKGGDKAMFILTQSFITGLASKISPDVKFFKEAKILEEGLIQALRNGNQAAVKTLVNNFTTALPKAMLREVAPELLQEYSERFLKSAGEIAQTAVTGKNQVSAITSDELIDTTIQTAATVATLGAIGHIRGSKNYEYEGQTYNIAGLDKNEQLSLLANIYNPTTFAEFKNKFGVSQDKIDKVENEVKTVKKYIDQIPNREDYTLNGMFKAGVILQDIERLKQSKTTAADVFHEDIDAKISAKTQELKDILERNKVEKTNPETNENPQPAQEQETTQGNTETTTETPTAETATVPTEPKPNEPRGNGGAEVGVGTDINTETNGQTANQEPNTVTEISPELQQIKNRHEELFKQYADENNGDNIDVAAFLHASQKFKQLREDGLQSGKVIKSSYNDRQQKLIEEYTNLVEEENKLKEANGQTTSEIEGTTRQVEGVGQTSKEAGQDASNQPTEVVGGVTQSEEVAKTPAQEIGRYIDLSSIDPIKNEGEFNEKEKLNSDLIEAVSNDIAKENIPIEDKILKQREILLNSGMPESDFEYLIDTNEESDFRNTIDTELKKAIGAEALDNFYNELSKSGNIKTTDLAQKLKHVKNEKTQTTQNQQVATEGNQPASDKTDEASNTSVQTKESKTTETITLSNPKYTLTIDKDEKGIKTFTFRNSANGKEVNPSDKTRRKYLLEYLKNTQFAETEIPEDASNNEAHKIIINESESPTELALALANIPKYRGDAEEGSKLWHIANTMRRVKKENLKRFGDGNKFSLSIAKSYFSRKNNTSENSSKNTIDQWAMEASTSFAGDYGGNEITTDDIVGFIEEYPNGANQYLKQETDDYSRAEERFYEITGLKPTENVLAELLGKKTSDEQSKSELKKRAEAHYDKLTAEQQKKLADNYDEWFNSLTLEQQQEELIKSYPYDIQGTTTTTGKIEIQPQSGNTEGQSGTNANAERRAGGSQKGQKVNPTSPEYKAAILRRDEAEKNLKAKKDNLSRVSARTNNDFQADQTDIFGNRISQEQPGMFDERADGNAGKEIIAKAKRELEEAQKEFTAANKAVKDFENGNIQGTNTIDFTDEGQVKEGKQTKKEFKKQTRLIRDEKVRSEINDALKDLQNSIRGTLNSGINPEIIIKGTKVISLYTKQRIYKFSDIITDAAEAMGEISQDMFDAMKQAYAAYSATADEAIYNELDHNVRDFSYDMLFAAEPEQEVDNFINRIQSELQSQTKLDIRKIRSIAREFGLDEVKDTTLQEYVETAIIKEAKSIAAQDIPRKEKYSKILELYKTQPTISMRSGNRVELQQYSTPIPMSFLAGEFINNANPDSVLEPSAGNGMMVFNIDASKITANEIDEVRLENLHKEGFKEVLNQDGREPFVGKFGALATNPPFGKSEAKNYNGYNISGLDPQMVINGLNSLDDNGVAAIIIGGNTEYNENGSLKSGKAFFNYLYNYYNVVDVINMDGQLYQKQGTTFPTRMILIAGRKRELVDKSNFKTTDFAPVQEEANTEPVKTFGALYNRVEKAINKVNDTNLLQREPQRADADSSAEPSEKNNRADDKGKTALSGKKSSDERGGYLPGDSGRDDGYGDSNGLGRTNQRDNADNGDGTLDSGNERGEGNSGRKRGESDVQDARTPILSDDATGSGGEPVSVDLSKEKAAYPAQSKSIQVGSVVPTNMAQPIANALREIGDVDAFVGNKLGYSSKEELYGAMSAEQIDGVALAISQVENRKGFIIGDMTGVGKGRQAAAMIRYAVEQGKRPIFITEKATLFSDIYRDLRDIGSGHLRPFIMNNKASDSDPNMTDENGNVVYATPKDNIKKQIFENGELPEEYDYMVMTYSQVNSEKTAQKRKLLRNLAENNIIILDESHNAGGQSQTGEFFQYVLDTTQGAVYLSGTFAKSHQNMPVYAIRTDMKDANMSQDEMIEAINKGGVPLMEIMSGDLVKAGQMIRRERDFAGVTIDWEMYDQDKEEQSKKFDQATSVFNEIISFEENHITPFIKNMDKALAKEQGNAKKRKGTNQMGVSNTPFASSLFNVVRQMLFSLKAEHIADQAIKELKAGRKPVIAFGSTMEGFLDEIGNGNTVDTHDFSLAMKRGLKSTLKYTLTDANGDDEHKFFELDELPQATQKAYKELEAKIENISTGLPISPIDVIKNKIQQAGYSVGEMTGRKSELKFNDDDTAEVVSRKDRDKKKLARQFNFGDIDVLMLNQSASTGISLHASKTFGDQRQRVMIFAQSQLDVNTEIQMRGRIDRTGQVQRGAYRYITSMIPAELRLTMMLKAKLKKLDATTTSDQKSKTNEIKVSDFLNKYGDDIVFEYLIENPELNTKLLDPLKLGNKDISEVKTAPENLASKVSGKVALLTTSEQERFYKEVSERYDAHIKYLDENNANDLEIKPLDLKAETKSIKTLIAGKQTGSVFGEDSMMEQVEINILKKPMTSQEIKAEVEKVLDGKTSAEYKEDLVAKAEEQLSIQNEKDADKIKNEKISATARAKYEKNAVEMGLIREGEDAIEYINSFAEKDKDEKIKEVQGKNRTKFNNIISTFRYFGVGQDYMIPFDAKVTPDTAYVNGKFLGFKVKDKYNPSSIVAIFATHDSRRKIEVPLSQVDYINAIKARPASRWDILTDEKWDKSIPTSSRKLGYIATGNLLQAYGSVNGQLISFTTKDGKIRQGILMPDNYKPEAQKMKVPITQVEGLLIDGRAVGDISGEVLIYPSGNGYAIEVPSSKAKGAKYFTNPDLKALMNENGFDRQVGTRFVANFNKQNLTNVLETLYKNYNTSVFTEAVSKKVEDIGSESLSTQARKKNLAPERIAPAKTSPSSEPKSKSQMVGDLARGLNAAIKYAKTGRRNALGTYDARSTLIRIKNAGDLDTVAHEVGHLLDDRFDIFETIDIADKVVIDDQLKWFSDRGGSNPPTNATPSQKSEYLQREGIAEFVRAYIVNKQEAKKKAPELFKHFENSIDAETKKVLAQYSKDVLDFENAHPFDQIGANIDTIKPEKKNKIKEAFNYLREKDEIFGSRLWSDFNVNFLNVMSRANKAFLYINKIQGTDENILPENDFRILNRLFNGVYGKIDRILKDGLVDSKNKFLKDADGNNMSVRWLFEPLDHSSEKVLEKEMEDVSKMLIAERTIEYARKFGRTEGLSGIGSLTKDDLTVAEDAMAYLEEMKAQNPQRYERLALATDRYREYADKVLRYSVDKGRISEESYKAIKDGNLFYVNMMRIKESSPTEEDVDNLYKNSSSITSSKEVIKKATGGSDRMRNPYDALLMTTAAIIREADRNEVMRSFIEPMRNNRKIGDGDPVDFTKVAWRAKPGDKFTRKIFIDGKLEEWAFAPEIITAVEALEGIEKSFPEAVKAPGKLIRWTVTHFPSFAARNLARDTVSRAINSYSIRGVKDLDLSHNKADRQNFDLFGGGLGGHFVDKNRYKKEIQTAMQALTDNGNFVLHPKQMWVKYKELLEKGENVNRITEFKSAYRQAKEKKFDDYNAGLYATARARDLLDFAVGGRLIKRWNQVIPFLNAGVQGTARTVRYAKENPAAFLIKTAIFTFIPQLITRAIVSAMGDDDDYERLPDYQRDFFWNFRTPWTGDKWIAIPKPFENGLASSLVDRVYSYANGNEDAMDGFFGSMSKSLIPVDESSWLGSIKPIVEVLANRDFFRDNNIVSYWDEDKMREKRKSDEYASRLSKGVTDVIYDLSMKKVDINPNNVDHLIKGYGTYMGNLALSISDIGKEGSRNKIGLPTTGFVKNAPVANAKNVQQLTDILKELGKASGKEMKRIKELQENYYKAETKEEKKRILHQLYNYADEKLEIYKKKKEEIKNKE